MHLDSPKCILQSLGQHLNLKKKKNDRYAKKEEKIQSYKMIN